MQPLSADAARSPNPPPPQLPPDSSRNQGSMTCTLLIGMPYYLLDLAPDKPAKIATWLKPVLTNLPKVFAYQQSTYNNCHLPLRKFQ